ncbi:biopolymer transporter ExbD [Candidatus Sumerlaeota bacterium]|nr:biopolymer transporter ExbD [Candidatus Sumerlaeota bacterium]
MISRARLSRRRSVMPKGINLAPMLDTVLNLIFFFLVATSLKSRNLSLNVHLPSSQSATSAAERRIPSVTLDAAGKIFYDGREREEQEFEEDMKKLAAQGTKEIDIRGDRDVNFGNVVHLMDLCKKAGLSAANWVAIGEKRHD